MKKYETPLNPELYDILWDYCNGDVLVAHHGAEFQYFVGTYKGRKSIEKAGKAVSEEYLVCCPLCGDSRNRCHVNHVFGTQIKGLTAPPLVHCLNEECSGLVKWFRDMLQHCGYTGATLAARDVTKQATPFDYLSRTVAGVTECSEMLPGIALLDTLFPDHPAVLYVQSRGFNPEYLAMSFGVGYFEGGGNPSLKQKRLIIPVRHLGIDVGWIARIIPGHTQNTFGSVPNRVAQEPPKYINAKGFHKSSFLYNLDIAMNYDVIVVAEGPTDVWRIGPWGVALMGKSMSDSQCDLLCRTAGVRGSWVVLLGDAPTERDDSVRSWTNNYRKLIGSYSCSGQVRLHMLDQGDPGDHDQRALYELVERVMREPTDGE